MFGRYRSKLLDRSYELVSRFSQIEVRSKRGHEKALLSARQGLLNNADEMGFYQIAVVAERNIGAFGLVDRNLRNGHLLSFLYSGSISRAEILADELEEYLDFCDGGAAAGSAAFFAMMNDREN
ncbi:hypothetical protein [Novosphingobium sp.]|uniref:hypothetical protein n=1 Tax=Novosphingobium sp. TaxID=1874826 RepID=UPI0033408014